MCMLPAASYKAIQPSIMPSAVRLASDQRNGAILFQSVLQVQSPLSAIVLPGMPIAEDVT